MGENGITLEKQVWIINKLTFEQQLEYYLSTCPNMIDRTLCEENCPLYELYCISIEPDDSVLEVWVDE